MRYVVGHVPGFRFPIRCHVFFFGGLPEDPDQKWDFNQTIISVKKMHMPQVWIEIVKLSFNICTQLPQLLSAESVSITIWSSFRINEREIVIWSALSVHSATCETKKYSIRFSRLSDCTWTRSRLLCVWPTSSNVNYIDHLSYQQLFHSGFVMLLLNKISTCI